MFACPYCNQNIISNHNRLLRHDKPNYYHIYWLEIAIENFKNNKEIVKVINKDMTISQFIQIFAKDQLDDIVDIE